MARRADLEETARIDVTLLNLAAKAEDARHSRVEASTTIPLRREESGAHASTTAAARRTDGEQTARVAVNVEAAFAEEPTTQTSGVPDGLLRDSAVRDEVDGLLPLNAVPVLRVPRDEVPWHELGELATRLLLRVDGAACMMGILGSAQAAPNEGARELAKLVSRGLVGVQTPPGNEDS